MFAACCLILIGVLVSQPETGWNFKQSADQGTEDVGLLNDSLRLVPLDMRLPDDWGLLYRLDSTSGPLFARRAGGVTAVFPQSTYAATRQGPIPLVPPDTIFVIGEPTPSLLRQLGIAVGDDHALLNPSPTRLSSAIRRSIDGRLSTGIRQARQASTPEESDPWTQRQQMLSDQLAEAQRQRDTSIWYNDELRQRRVGRLLDQALRRACER